MESYVGFKERTEPQATEAKPRCDQQHSDASCFFLASSSGQWAASKRQWISVLKYCSGVLTHKYV